MSMSMTMTLSVMWVSRKGVDEEARTSPNLLPVVTILIALVMAIGQLPGAFDALFEDIEKGDDREAEPKADQTQQVGQQFDWLEGKCWED